MKRPAQRLDSSEHIPWYTLNPRHIRLRRIFIPILIFLLLYPCSEKHFWRWTWQFGYHAYLNCHPITDMHGRHIETWRWVEGQEIRLYTSPSLAASHVRLDAASMQELIDGLGLNITVRIMPQPERVSRALARSLLHNNGETCVSFTRLCRELASTREGRYAEMVYVPGMIDSEPEVTGSAMFTYGVGILSTKLATSFTARHELGHLLGYHMHDSWPLVVVGYSNPQWASHRQKYTGEYETLMMPNAEGYELSPRARDALICFWHGLEQRTGKRFFLTQPAPPEEFPTTAPRLRLPGASGAVPK